MFLNTGVSTHQVHASHTSAWYKVYMRPRRITRNSLAVLCHFWYSVFTRKICRQLQGYSEFGQYSLCLGIFFHKEGDSNDDDPLVIVLDDSTDVDLEVSNEDTYNLDLSLSAVANVIADATFTTGAHILESQDI